MSNILITAARLARAHALKRQIEHHNIILGDYAELPVLAGHALFEPLPHPQSDSYVHEFLTLCLHLNVSRVYLLDETECLALKAAVALFDEYAIELNFVP